MPEIRNEDDRRKVQSSLRSVEIPDLSGFDVSSGTFPLTPASAGIGKSYRVTGAGTVGSVAYAVGDIVVSNGGEWIKQGGGGGGAPINSPNFVGTPTAPNPVAGTNTQQLATTAFVKAALDALVGGAPGTLDTLNELAAAIGDNENFAAGITALINLHTSITSGNPHGVTKADVLLDQVANLAPLDLPVSTQQQAAIAAAVLPLAPLSSPTFVGTPLAPNPTSGTNNMQIATTAFVQETLNALFEGAPGALDTLAEISAALGDDANFSATITNQLSLKAPIASPTFTGVPEAPTAAPNANNMQIATTAFVQTATDDKAPLASPVLTGLPQAPTPTPGTNTAQIATTAFVQAATGDKAPIASPTFTGTPAAPTPAAGTNDTQLATTAYVQGETSDKAPLASPTFTGVPLAPTPAPNTNNTQLATTAYVQGALAGVGDVADKAPLASPTFTGVPLAPTPASGTNTQQIATTAFVAAAVGDLVANSPAALDTLNELAAALGDDANFSATITNQLSLKAPIASPTFTGAPLAPTATPNTDNTQIATTAFVQAATGDKAPLDSPALTGTPTAPAPASGTNTAQIATTAFVQAGLGEKLPISGFDGVLDETGIGGLVQLNSTHVNKVILVGNNSTEQQVRMSTADLGNLPSSNGRVLLKNIGTMSVLFIDATDFGTMENLHDPYGNSIPRTDGGTVVNRNKIEPGGVLDILIADGKLYTNSKAVSNVGDQEIWGVKTFDASPIVPTAAANDNSGKAASTAYVDAAVGGGGGTPKVLRYRNSLNSNQTVPSTTRATVTCLDDSIFDNTGGWFNSVTGFFQPDVAGFYEISASVEHTQTGATESSVSLLKNADINNAESSRGYKQDVPSKIFELNGSTDYVVLSLFYTGGSLTTINPAGSCEFQAKQIK